MLQGKFKIIWNDIKMRVGVLLRFLTEESFKLEVHVRSSAVGHKRNKSKVLFAERNASKLMTVDRKMWRNDRRKLNEISDVSKRSTEPDATVTVVAEAQFVTNHDWFSTKSTSQVQTRFQVRGRLRERHLVVAVWTVRLFSCEVCVHWLQHHSHNISRVRSAQDSVWFSFSRKQEVRVVLGANASCDGMLERGGE